MPIRPKTILQRQPKRDDRPSPAARGYTALWSKARAAYIQANPLCEPCLRAGRTAPAEIVHHRQSIRTGGATLPGAQGLESCCRKCHGHHHRGGR